MKRRARFAAVVTLSCGLGVQAASCRSVVVGKTENGVEALCELLQTCYGANAPSCATLDSKFARAPSDANATFLSSLEGSNCLAGCSNAKVCWDEAPICSALGERGCKRPQDCCGFTSGKASCDQVNCCVPHAVTCVVGGPPCCHGERCFSPDENKVPRTCGGAPPCSDEGASCTSNGDCCSKRCSSSGVCEKQNLCQPEGSSCVSDKDCCESLSCLSVAGKKQCSKGSTCSIGDACSPPSAADGAVSCTLDAPDACCGNPQNCVVDESGLTGVCVDVSQGVVVPEGFECATDANCCAGLYCDKSSIPVCAKKRTCAVYPPSCVGSGCITTCATNADCCADQCVNGACTCGISTCHPPSDEGPPIACPTMGPTPDPTSSAYEACATKVCAVDPACCCTAWDEICVHQAVATCGL